MAYCLSNDLLVNIILVFGLITILHYWICFFSDIRGIERFNSYESIQDIASVYNNGTLTVNNLVVTNSAKITKLDVAENTVLRSSSDCPLTLKKNPGSTRWNYIAFVDEHTNRDGWMGVKGDNNHFSIQKESDPRITNVDQRMMSNTRMIDGSDIKDFTADNFDDCTNKCNNINAASAQFQKADKHCWCKSSNATYNAQTDFESVALTIN